MHPIKIWRLKRELSQEHVAQMIGVSQSMISLIEAGEREVSPKAAHKLEEASGGELTRERLIPAIFGPIKNNNITRS